MFLISKISYQTFFEQLLKYILNIILHFMYCWLKTLSRFEFQFRCAYDAFTWNTLFSKSEPNFCGLSFKNIWRFFTNMVKVVLFFECYTQNSNLNRILNLLFHVSQLSFHAITITFSRIHQTPSSKVLCRAFFKKQNWKFGLVCAGWAKNLL